MREEKVKVLDYIEEHFGIDKRHFQDFELYLGSKGRVFLGPKKFVSLPSTVSVGILIARINNSVKPSTNLLQLLGKYATKNIIQLSKDRAISYIRGEDFRLSEEETKRSEKVVGDGYVLMKYLDFSLGCAFLKNGSIRNMLPKAKRAEVKFI